MKKIVILFSALLCIIISSCRHRDDLSITVRDSDRYLTMKAHFDKSKTNRVKHYLEQNLNAHLSFRNNSQGIFINEGKFYMRSYAGHINIKLDKYENSREAYYRVKSICEGV